MFTADYYALLHNCQYFFFCYTIATNYHAITAFLIRITQYYILFLSITTSLLRVPITLRLLRMTSRSLLHITSLGVSNTNNYLRNVICRNGSIIIHYYVLRPWETCRRITCRVIQAEPCSIVTLTVDAACKGPVAAYCDPKPWSEQWEQPKFEWLWRLSYARYAFFCERRMDQGQVWNEDFNLDLDTHNDTLAEAALVTCRPKKYQHPRRK